MADILPEHAPIHVTVALPFRVADEWLDKHLAETGEWLGCNHTLRVLLCDLEPEVRRDAISVDKRRDGLGENVEIRPTVDVFLPEEPLQNVPAVVSAWRRALDEWEDGELQRMKAHRDRLAAEAAESQRFRSEMERWIASCGSRRLKLALERNYKVSGAYVRERAAQEFPGFMVDTNGESDFRERTNPSEKALDLEAETLERVDPALRANVRVVWLTEPPKAFWSTHTVFEHVEAVMVDGYLDRYRLVALVHPIPQPADDIPF